MSELTQRDELAAIIHARGCGHGHAFLIGATHIADALLPFIERVKVEAWSEGFKVGTEAGARWMENGGPDDDDVNPYRDSQQEPPEIFPGTHAALDDLTVRAADGSGRHFMDDFQPVKCEICGRTMPRGIADDPERHSCAKTLEPGEDA